MCPSTSQIEHTSNLHHDNTNTNSIKNVTSKIKKKKCEPPPVPGGAQARGVVDQQQRGGVEAQRARARAPALQRPQRRQQLQQQRAAQAGARAVQEVPHRCPILRKLLKEVIENLNAAGIEPAL